MNSMQLYQDLEIGVKKLEPSVAKLHRHHFFELIYVLEGSGIHIINGNKYKFSHGDVFLLAPEDAHTFKITSSIKVCIVDFTKSFFSKSNVKGEEKMEVSDFFKRLEFIFLHHHNVRGNIISPLDKKVFEALINQLVTEKENEQIFHEIILQNIIFLLLHLLARNIQSQITATLKGKNPKSNIHEITAYIQHNIYDKELVKVENIACRFHKSADYLNRYFKSQTGSSIKDYIIQYKLNLTKARLKYSDLTISEIADELNYTDESHLNKMFKKKYGITAKQYKFQSIR